VLEVVVILAHAHLQPREHLSSSTEYEGRTPPGSSTNFCPSGSGSPSQRARNMREKCPWLTRRTSLPLVRCASRIARTTSSARAHICSALSPPAQPCVQMSQGAPRCALTSSLSFPMNGVRIAGVGRERERAFVVAVRPLAHALVDLHLGPVRGGDAREQEFERALCTCTWGDHHCPDRARVDELCSGRDLGGAGQSRVY
jgi:hypothetical protein